MLLGAPLKAEYLFMICFGIYLRVDNKFFTKHEENLRAKHLEGDFEKGGGEARDSLASPHN